MAHGPTFRVAFRRRRQGRTDYRHRLRVLRSGQARIVVRRTNNNTIVQVIEYNETGDRVLATAQATELRKHGWTGHTGNLPAAYLAGLVAGRRAKRAGVETGVFDIGHQAPIAGGAVFAALAGLIAAGVDVPHGEDVLPSEERIQGGHTQDATKNAFATVKAKIEGGEAD
jgi:large subunit ribosomal protein L18